MVRSRWFAGVFVNFVAVLAITLSSTAARAENPSPPGSLRYQVYSRTAAELFWDRSINDPIVVAYEIQTNGEIVATIDALSYFTRTLVSGTSYTFVVTAIDSDGNRSDSATVTFIGGDRTPTDDDQPRPPENLYVEIYSSSAFEIFWDRVPDAILNYEISLDGQLVETTDGKSWFADGLDRGRQYSVDVVAVDTTGNRSIAASIIATTRGDSIATKPPVPENARLEVYSSTAAELFWDRPPAEAGVVSTRVVRDGELIADTDGISFFDDERARNTSYRYELIAVNSSGGTSSPTVVEEDDSDPGGSGISMVGFVSVEIDEEDDAPETDLSAGFIRFDDPTTSGGFFDALTTQLAGDICLVIEDGGKICLVKEDGGEICLVNEEADDADVFDLEFYADEPIGAGQTLTFTSPAGTYATLEGRALINPIGGVDNFFYVLPGDSLAGPPPAELTLDIPGDVFPAFANVTVPDLPAPLTDFSPPISSPAGTTTAFRWTPSGVAGARISLGLDSDAESIDCRLVDDGSFTLPDSVSARLSSTFDGIVRDADRDAIAITRSDDAVVVVITEDGRDN